MVLGCDPSDACGFTCSVCSPCASVLDLHWLPRRPAAINGGLMTPARPTGSNKGQKVTDDTGYRPRLTKPQSVNHTKGILDSVDLMQTGLQSYAASAKVSSIISHFREDLGGKSTALKWSVAL